MRECRVLDEELVLCRKAAGLRLSIDEALRRSGESFVFIPTRVFPYYTAVLSAQIFYILADFIIQPLSNIQLLFY